MLTIKQLREGKGWSQTELAEKLNVSLRTVQNYESDQDNLTQKKLSKIYKTLQSDEFPTMVQEEKSDYSKSNSDSAVWVPYYDLDFSGGWTSEEIESEQKPSFFITAPEFERAEFACNLFGHSISNRIVHRSVIGLKEVFDWQTYFPTNEIYGVVMKNNLRTVKIVKRSKSKDGFLDLIPDPKPEHNNTGYEKEEVPISFVTRFFQVVAWGCFERIAM